MSSLSCAVVFFASAILAFGASAMADPEPSAKIPPTTRGAAARNANPILDAAEANANDIHCLVIYMLMGGAEDAKFKAAGVTGTLYFTGKLDGRDPNLDIEGGILAELPKLKGDLLKSEAQRCGHELTARGEAEITMTQDLQQRVEKLKQEQNPGAGQEPR